jgi:hypothetical protein
MADEPELKKVHVVHDKDATGYASSSVFDDLAGLRKAQKITVVRKTVLINVKVDKPANNVHFRAHPEWYLDDCSIVHDRNAQTFYYVHPIMRSHPKLAPRLRYVTLGVIYLWPSGALQIWPVPKLEGKRELPAWKSARKAYELSRGSPSEPAKWVEIVWDDALSDYTVETAEHITAEPIWPVDKTFNDLLKLGFDGKIIDSDNHDYVRQLRGLDT